MTQQRIREKGPEYKESQLRETQSWCEGKGEDKEGGKLINQTKNTWCTNRQRRGRAKQKHL